MTRRLILHIGAHKTATTTIQRACRTNRARLAEHGVLYPEACRFHFAHHRLPFALKGKRDPARGDVPDFDTEIAALRAEVLAAPQPVTLVSSEDLFVLRRPFLRRLVAGLDFAEIHVLAMVRRQDDYLLSFYNQNAKDPGNGYVRPLPDLVADPRSTCAEIDYRKWLGFWQAAVGDGRVRLARFEDGDPLATVLGHLDLPPDLIAAPRRANESLPARAVETIRLAKRLPLPARGRALAARLARRLFAGGARHTLSAADRRRILEEFTEDNAALFAGFGMDNGYAPETLTRGAG